MKIAAVVRPDSRWGKNVVPNFSILFSAWLHDPLSLDHLQGQCWWSPLFWSASEQSRSGYWSDWSSSSKSFLGLGTGSWKVRQKCPSIAGMGIGDFPSLMVSLRPKRRFLVVKRSGWIWNIRRTSQSWARPSGALKAWLHRLRTICLSLASYPILVFRMRVLPYWIHFNDIIGKLSSNLVECWEGQVLLYKDRCWHST